MPVEAPSVRKGGKGFNYYKMSIAARGLTLGDDKKGKHRRHVRPDLPGVPAPKRFQLFCQRMLFVIDSLRHGLKEDGARE